MKFDQSDRWEDHVQQLADEFVYPATPTIAERVGGRLQRHEQHTAKWRTARLSPRLFLRPRWALVLGIIALVATLWSIPTVRAAVTEWIALGAVRIWLAEPPSGVPTQPATAPQQSTTPLHRVTPTMPPLSTVTDLAGETTLAAAQSAVDFPIRLPTLPANLGEPDHVYLQQAEGDMVILVWMQPSQPATVRLSLHLLGPGAFVWKMQPADTVNATVNGSQAFWTQGPYYIKAGPGQSWTYVRLVTGGVLIWIDGEMTYRLESDLPLAKAIRVAESLGR